MVSLFYENKNRICFFICIIIMDLVKKDYIFMSIVERGDNMDNIRCIICGQLKNGSDEHIIPKSLGNETLRINNICKECNDGLGQYVDEHLVNNFVSQLIRQQLKLRGQSKTIPNPFKKGVDSEGNIINVDDQFRPFLNPKVIEKEETIQILSATEEEAVKIAKKKLKRKGFSDEEIKNRIDNMKKQEVEGYTPKIYYNIEINMKKIFLGLLKIAYEYAYYTFGDIFYNDKTAKEIRDILLDATKGIFDKEYEKIYTLPSNIIDNIRNLDLKCHLLEFFKTNDNKLMLCIILFFEPILSGCICISENASIYDINNRQTFFIVDIKNSEYEI